MANRKIWLILAVVLVLAGSLAAQQMQRPLDADDDSPMLQERLPVPEPANRQYPAARPAEQPPASTSSTYRSRIIPELPAGTAIYFQLQKVIDSSNTKRGDGFAGMVTRAVVVEGHTVIPVGCTITGHITRVSNPRRITGRPMLNLRPDEITFPDGSKRSMSAIIVDTDPPSLKVDEEGRIRGRGRTTADNLEMAVVTAAGAGTGAVIAGPAGALLGAGAGATATTAHWLIKHHSMELGPGMTLIAELSRAMSLNVTATARESRGD